MSHQCSICYNDFTWDPSSKDKSHLPVQSRVCSHVLCHSCMIAIYQASEGDTVLVACPECRLRGAHDPFVPIVSLPLCELLAERHQMVQSDPNLERVGRELRRQALERRSAHRSAADLLIEAALEKADCLRRTLQEKFTVKKPLVRLTKEASRAVYWGSILVFGTIDRNETVIVERKSVAEIWNSVSAKVTEGLEGPLRF